MPKTIPLAFTDADVRRIAGDLSYRRGADLFSQGHVEALKDWGDSIGALVGGDPAYAVTLESSRRDPYHACDCAEGTGGVFCQHCVAAALAWLNRGEAAGGEASEPVKPNPAVVRRAFEKAVRVRDFVHARDAEAWAQGVNDAIESVERLLGDGQAAAVVELAEWAIQSLLGSIERVDDSAGHFGALRDRLQDLHYRGCQQAKPDPVELSKRIFRWELHCDYEVFAGALARYSGILGEDGLKVYRALAEAEWEQAQASGGSKARSGDGEYARLTRIMQTLAVVSGSVGQLVAAMSSDLSSASSYCRIAEVYREAKQPDQALLWAEKGLRAFPDRTGRRLREFAAEEYHRCGRHQDAMELMWAQFLELPDLEAFQNLERHGRKAAAWPAWRDRALAEIRQRIARVKEKTRGQIRSRRMQVDDDHAPLVEVFLYEGDADRAWSEAQAGGCSESLWLRLAAAREKDHPADAPPIYLRQAEAAVAGSSDGRYYEAVDLLLKAAVLMRRLGRGAEFGRQVDALCAKYKVKRAFIKLVEQKRKSLYPASKIGDTPLPNARTRRR